MKYDELTDDTPIPEPQISGISTKDDWNSLGTVTLPNFLPDRLIDPYCIAHEEEDLGKDVMDATAYMRVPELMDICCYGPLAEVLEEIIGEPMGVHLNLTGWLSTERNWHMDAYLSPPEVGDYYAAVWFALDDIHPDAGPFEWIPRSHLWPQISGEKVRARLPDEQANHPMWPKYSEDFLTEAIEEKIALNGVPPKKFLGRRGEVLIWHSRIIHRGSPPKVPGMQRKGLIAHFSSVHRRPDMSPAIQHPSGGWYFPFEGGRAKRS